MKELWNSFKEKKWFYLGIVIGLFFLTGMIYVLYYSDLFLLKEIEVKGDPEFSKEEVIKLSGLHGGERLYRISLEKIRKKLMQDPRIGNVIIVRRLPCSLEIIIKQREPVGIVKKRGGYYLIDKHGILIKRAEKEHFSHYPLIIVKNEEEEKRLLNFLSWLKRTRKYLPVFDNLKEVILKEDRVIFITKNSGIKIYFPVKSKKSWKYFYRNLDRIMAYLHARKKLMEKVEIIRLDYPVGEALIKFKNGNRG